jgi:hypothetical protein
MKRKFTFLALYAVLFALCFSAEGQQPKKIPRIGHFRGLSHFKIHLREFFDSQRLFED